MWSTIVPSNILRKQRHSHFSRLLSLSTGAHDALDIVDHVHLAHPTSALLRAYILEAVQPQAAADYVQRRLNVDGHADTLVTDWIYVIDSVISGTQRPAPSADEVRAIIKREGNRCCVTGKQGSLWDPVIVAPIFRVPSGWLKSEPSLVVNFDWWYRFIDRIETSSPYHTHWLVRRSVNEALQRGIVKLVRVPSSMIEVEHVLIDDEQPVDLNGDIALLGDHSRQGIEKADARLIGSHARFCRSIQLVNLARSIAPGLFSEQTTIPDPLGQQLPTRMLSSNLGLGHVFLRPIMLLWQFFPSMVRITAYELLRKMGNRLYGKDGHAPVQRLPFGLYLKYHSNSDTLRNEYNALKVLEQEANIPAPRALDLVSQSTGDNDFSYHLTTRVPMRDIPKPANYGMAICNTLGEACRDPRIRDSNPIGPFPDEASFSQHLRFSDEPSRRGHKIAFTHGDLNPRNIMVERIANPVGPDRWQLSGIVDWEMAGYSPDYWDYTKSIFEGFRWPRWHNEMMQSVSRTIARN